MNEMIKPRLQFINLCEKSEFSWAGWMIYLLPTIHVSYDGFDNIDGIKELSISFLWLFCDVTLRFEKEGHRD